MNKKLGKKIITTLVAVTLLLSSSTVILAQGTKNHDELEYSQDAALEAYNGICEGLSIDFSYENNDLPEELGGFYLDKNVLVIQLTNTTNEIKNKYLNYCNDFEDVVFEKVEYSYKYLNSLKNTISTLSRGYKVYEYFIDVYTNKLIIGVDNTDLESIENISTYSSLPISFVESQPATPTAMQGGEEIVVGGRCSIGYFGTFKGKKALLTCGHDNPINTNVTYNGNNIGSVVYQNLNLYPMPFPSEGLYWSYGDFSIVDISNSSVATSNRVVGYGGFTVTIDGTANVVAGLEVKYAGMKTKYGSGTITSTEVTKLLKQPINFKEYVVKGLCVVTASTNLVDGGR